MPEMTQYPPGTFCWVELGTRDADAAKRFYGELFGWRYNDVPVGPDSVYSMVQVQGKDVAAIYQLDPKHFAQGEAPQWLSYIAVDDADETAGRAKSLDATVVMEPFDVFDAGRMATLLDPLDARFAVWQPRNHIGARIVGEPGTFCWNEVATPDARAAAEFYGSLFGWSSQTRAMGSMDYTSFMNGDRPVGGMFELTPDMSGMRPAWLVYFAVEDCDRSADRARKLGAQVHVPPTDIPSVGRFAMVADPQGTLFYVIRLEMSAQ